MAKKSKVGSFTWERDSMLKRISHTGNFKQLYTQLNRELYMIQKNVK